MLMGAVLMVLAPTALDTTPMAVAVVTGAPLLMDYFAADTKHQTVQQVHLCAIFVAGLRTAHPVALVVAAIWQCNARDDRSCPSASVLDPPAAVSPMRPTSR